MTELVGLEVVDLSYRLDGMTILDGVTLVVRCGEIVAVVGPNGAGKTTLFEIISGYALPSSGVVRLGGDLMTGLPPHEVAAWGVRRVFQEVRVFSHLTALENVLVGLRVPLGEGALTSLVRRRWRTRRAEAIEKAHSKLKTVGLENEANRDAGQLSFGQQKLLGFATLLASDARLLLLDEPTSGLAPGAIQRVLKLIKRLAEDERRSIVLIEHDLEVVEQICDRAYLLQQGRIFAEGTARSVVTHLEKQKARLTGLHDLPFRHAIEEDECSL